MTRLRISLALLLFPVLSCSLLAQGRNDFTIEKNFDDEVSARTEEIMKYCDADNNGVLTHPETKMAVLQVTEAMTDRLPAASYVSGGDVTIRKMRKVISQKSIDRNADHEVDKTELGIFIGYAVAQSEIALRTPHRAQYAITMEETADNVMKYTWALETERRRRDNWKWHNLGIQQQKETHFEIQARKREQRARDLYDIARAREAADRDAKLRETSPGLLPAEAIKPAAQP